MPQGWGVFIDAPPTDPDGNYLHWEDFGNGGGHWTAHSGGNHFDPDRTYQMGDQPMCLVYSLLSAHGLLPAEEPLANPDTHYANAATMAVAAFTNLRAIVPGNAVHPGRTRSGGTVHAEIDRLIDAFGRTDAATNGRGVVRREVLMSKDQFKAYFP